MRKLLYILTSVALLACADDETIKGTAVSFYPNLVDAVVEGGTSTATLELSGPGIGTAVIRVSDPEFVTTDPQMVDGLITVEFDDNGSQTIDIEVARGTRSDDYIINFDVVSLSGGIEDIASGRFKLFVNAIPALQLPFFDDFEDCSEEFATPAKWIEEFVGDSKTDRGWACRATEGLNGTNGVRASAFGGEPGTDHAWLISNGSFDLTSASEAFMTLDMKSSFSGDGELFVMWSEDYSGAGDPTVATWQEVPGVSSQLPVAGTNSYKKVAAELTAMVGKKIFIGFQYIGASSSSSTSYELDNFSVSEDGAGFEFYGLPFSDDLNSCGNFSIPSTFIQERAAGSKQDRGWECGANGVSGSQAVRATAFGGADGAVDAWLISAKAFDLSSTMEGTLTFDIKSATAGSGALNILWSENYTGSGEPTVATWTEFTGFTAPIGGSDSYETTDVDIQAALGKTVYLAYQFVGGTNSSSISFDIDNIIVASGSGSGGGGGGGTGGGGTGETCSGTVIVSHDFEGCTDNFSVPNGFIEENVPGTKTDRGWGCRDDGTDGSRAVRASAFGGEDGVDDAWLIMNAIDATPYSEICLKFDVQSLFSGPGDLLVFYSNDYSGSGDPTSATWTELSDVTSQLPAQGSSVFATVVTTSTEISGSSVYIAFQYVNGESGASSAWSIDNLELTGN